ncbi:hypothetical protein HG537_0G02890 [Torulaspora globosa]|uniref:Uncharacterized protein n=1 Tax=Torulaspora globosa TaxID=48254 RepID=A0A7H9HZL8_9SACH|nr:hypothetical protein HG537_0G02890 [Torulaspora sp. CBS 2947]
MQRDGGNSLNNRRGSQRNDSTKGNATTVESLAAAIEKKALGKSSDALNLETDVKRANQDGTVAMKAMLDERLKILENRTDQEIKRIVRREYLKDVVTNQD